MDSTELLSLLPDRSSGDKENPARDERARFLAYLARVKVIAVRAIKAKIRYMAYSSDLGESLRPVLRPWMVNMFYAVSFGYVGFDVAYTGYLEQQRGSSDELVARQTLEAFVFQGVASLALPSLIIHTAVHQTHSLLKRTPRVPGLIMTWGPSVVGLSLVPLLPLIDPPIEQATEYAFDQVWPTPVGWLRRGHDASHHGEKHDGAAPAAAKQSPPTPQDENKKEK
mmetsp:Transcript_29595/g.86326  ORF Transcript_29595/g.86326 Transcript_29595/m.86326 type:complete len:225 (-) Transcript_29595:179-853(-)